MGNFNHSNIIVIAIRNTVIDNSHVCEKLFATASMAMY